MLMNILSHFCEMFQCERKACMTSCDVIAQFLPNKMRRFRDKELSNLSLLAKVLHYI